MEFSKKLSHFLWNPNKGQFSSSTKNLEEATKELLIFIKSILRISSQTKKEEKKRKQTIYFKYINKKSKTKNYKTDP